MTTLSQSPKIVRWLDGERTEGQVKPGFCLIPYEMRRVRGQEAWRILDRYRAQSPAGLQEVLGRAGLNLHIVMTLPFATLKYCEISRISSSL